MTRRVLVLCATVALAAALAGCRGADRTTSSGEPGQGSGTVAEQQVAELESAVRDIEREVDADRG